MKRNKINKKIEIFEFIINEYFYKNNFILCIFFNKDEKNIFLTLFLLIIISFSSIKIFSFAIARYIHINPNLINNSLDKEGLYIRYQGNGNDSRRLYSKYYINSNCRIYFSSFCCPRWSICSHYF